METKRSPFVLTKEITLIYEHNPYDVVTYFTKRPNGKTIIFPIFNYQKDSQYVDLIYPLAEKGYRIIAINLLNMGDRVLFFNYYFEVFHSLVSELYVKKIITSKDQIIIMGFGIGANLASYTNLNPIDQVKVSKIILISPINRYKSDYRISREIANFTIPTHIFYGQFDTVIDVGNKYSLFQNGRDNPNVTFSCYPATGHYLYYESSLSMDLESLYRNSDFDLLVGETRKNKIPFLPTKASLNDTFFKHLFNILEDIPNPKRVALLTDVSPLFVNGVEMVVKLLQKELDKLGYETYVVSLWKKHTDLALLPNDHFIPVLARYAKLVRGYKDLSLLENLNFHDNARMLTLFGFSYLHLHTEYSMGKIAVELSKLTNIKMPYSYHTLWKMYYENKFGKLAGDITYNAAHALLFKKVYKECPLILVPSLKSYDILKNDSHHKDVRIVPSPIDDDNFVLTREDRLKITELRNTYRLKGKKVIGYVGRVSTEKNITETIYYLSQVVNEIPNIMFMIVGVGDAVKQLQKYAKKLHVEDYIIYVGQVPNEELKLYYSLFDVFVTASNFETQGLTYFEAATIGTLILAKKDKAIEDVFEDGVNAFVYDGFYSWLERLEKALFNDNHLIVNAAKMSMKKYTKSKWAKKIASYYVELNKD